MRTLDEIRRTPVGLLTEDEISQLDTQGQQYARKIQAQRKRENECPGHEAVSTSTIEQRMHGWHPAHCKHCGMDMGIDSGD